MKEGDPHPTYPDVLRLNIDNLSDANPCIGCPVTISKTLMCTEHRCGNGFVWYGEHIKVIAIAQGVSND